MSIVIKVGTTNPVKVKAIKEAFEHYFEDVQVRTYKIASYVPEQPIAREVMMGAENRLQNLKRTEEEYDFLVSCEAGIIEQEDHWFNVQLVVIEDKNGKRSTGLSPSFEIPKKYVIEVVQTKATIANILDRLFDGEGGIRVLSRGQFTREKMIHDGTVMALSGLINGDIW